MRRWKISIAQELDPRIPHDEEAQTAVALRDWKSCQSSVSPSAGVAPDDVGIKTNFAAALMNGEGDFAAARANPRDNTLSEIRRPWAADLG